MFQVNLNKFFLLIRWVAALYLLWFMTQNRSSLSLYIPEDYMILGFFFENIFASALCHYSVKRSSLMLIVTVLDLISALFLLFAFKGNYVWLAFLIFPILSASTFGFRISLIVTLIQSVIYIMILEYYGRSAMSFPTEAAFLGLVIFLAMATVGLVKDVYDVKSKEGNSLISLIESGQELGTTATYETVFTLMSTIVKGLFASHTCIVYIREPREELMKVRFAESPYEKLFIDFDPAASKSLLSKALKEKKPVLIEDLLLCGEEELLPKAKVMRSVMVAPFVFQGNVFGCALVAHQLPHHFQGNSLGMFTILANQAAISIRNIQLHEATATMAVTDSVSGLFTHGYFQDNLEKEFQRCKYANLPLSLLILDVDHFKRINDTYGHPQGDAILRQLGGVIKSVTRATDIVCRYGGDEFTVTLSETNRIGAVLVAERVRRAVEEYEFVSGGKVLHISVSGGVASFPEDIATKKELIEKADQALYEAKKQGRNRICFSA